MKKTALFVVVLMPAWAWAQTYPAGYRALYEAPPAVLQGPTGASLTYLAETGYSGSYADVSADAGGSFDGNAAKPDTVDAGSKETIDLHAGRDFPIGRWNADGGKPAGFDDVPDKEKKKEEEPGIGKKIMNFIKGLELGGWLVKIGLVMAFFGVFTFSGPLMWAGAGMMVGGLLWGVIFG